MVQILILLFLLITMANLLDDTFPSQSVRRLLLQALFQGKDTWKPVCLFSSRAWEGQERPMNLDLTGVRH